MKFTIDGYEAMTPEQKVAALEAYEPDMSGFVSKATFDKTASDLAAAKKSLRDRMSEDEAKAAKAAEEHAALLARVQELEQERAVSGYANAYLAMGYSEKLAKTAASALAKGDMDAVFKAQREHAAAREQALRAELLQKTPTPPAGDPAPAMKKEDFAKMSLLEKQKFAKENPELYASFYNKEE